ncbi:hypothetical protein [Deinococcus roseus]|uniref:hypothetical protein n=1 Tax=Deinococcus roseus TaxID=392414 RepID=UPI00166CD57B|nr:hypothetical protein [Deinococcus roseus]
MLFALALAIGLFIGSAFLGILLLIDHLSRRAVVSSAPASSSETSPKKWVLE